MKIKLTNWLGKAEAAPKAANGSLFGVVKALEAPDTNPDDELKLLNGSNEAWKQKINKKEIKVSRNACSTHP